MPSLSTRQRIHVSLNIVTVTLLNIPAICSSVSWSACRRNKNKLFSDILILFANRKKSIPILEKIKVPACLRCVYFHICLVKIVVRSSPSSSISSFISFVLFISLSFSMSLLIFLCNVIHILNITLFY